MFLSGLFGDLNKREVDRYQKDVVISANKLESELEALSNEQLKEKSLKLKEEIQTKAAKIIADTSQIFEDKDRNRERKKAINSLLEPHMAYAFSLVREAAKRTIGLRHYDVQLVGGAVLHHGQIAEMQTGEGKTLVATLPLYLNALTGLGSHLITVNDYLARRDAGWMGPIYNFLGVSVAVIAPDYSAIYEPEHINEESDERLKHLKPISRRDAYYSDITYGTNNEFGFDYLRDNMAQGQQQLVQRELAYAIVDEVDSILIDEARTPLIISTFSDKSAQTYQRFAELIPKLKIVQDYTVDEKSKSSSFTDEGIKKLEQYLGISNLYDPQHSEMVHYADSSLRAYALFKKNKDYVVKDGEVVIVDEFTGRMLQGRRYSAGLHQAIEAKERVNVQQESVTLATITFQNYFRLYYKLAGMTGTAATEAEEFAKIYSLEVTSVPTNRPNQRKDLADVVYKTEESKFKALVDHIKELQEEGQPVLVGTVSISKSERLSKLLKEAGVKHSVLNAKQHQKEGEIVSQAGSPGAVMVATNMAGRGVDIVLGGKQPDKDADKSEYAAWEKSHQKVIDLGGLFVVGTERHESRRIDNQLRGRSARQGDPGVSQFYLSMEDDLMRIFGGDRMKKLMEQLKIPDDMAINNRFLTRAIEQSQTRVEGYNFDLRKQLVEYDDVTNRQREAIYSRRRRVLTAENPQDWPPLHEEILSSFTDEDIKNYAERSKDWPEEVQAQLERIVTLRAIDLLWVEHLKNLEDLRESIGLRGYGQRDPIVEYKQESYNLFQDLQRSIDEQVKQTLLRMEIQLNNAPKPEPQERKDLHLSGGDVPEKESVVRHGDKIGRNDPCPCGAIDPQTGKVYKYKKCGLVNAPHHKG
jgi:preprotein translocase subunit SecA